MPRYPDSCLRGSHDAVRLVFMTLRYFQTTRSCRTLVWILDGVADPSAAVLAAQSIGDSTSRSGVSTQSPTVQIHYCLFCMARWQLLVISVFPCKVSLQTGFGSGGPFLSASMINDLLHLQTHFLLRLATD